MRIEMLEPYYAIGVPHSFLREGIIPFRLTCRRGAYFEFANDPELWIKGVVR